jgi:hypothetical protein
MSLGNGNPKEGDKGSNFNYELKVLQGLESIAVALENQPPPPVITTYGLFAQTVNSTPVTGTVSELSLIRTGVGTLTVPANSFKVGDSFHATLAGHMSSANNQTLHLRVKAGGIILADTGVITNIPTITNRHWVLDINFTIRTIGAAGTASIASAGLFTYSKNASNAFEGADFSIINSSTFNTTISNTLEITAQWGSTNASNSIYSEVFTLYKTF